MPRQSTKSYNIAVINTEGSPTSTQLWDVIDSDKPLHVVAQWAMDDSKKLTRDCPVVIALHGGMPVFLTVGDVLDFFKGQDL